MEADGAFEKGTDLRMQDRVQGLEGMSVLSAPLHSYMICLLVSRLRLKINWMRFPSCVFFFDSVVRHSVVLVHVRFSPVLAAGPAASSDAAALRLSACAGSALCADYPYLRDMYPRDHQRHSPREYSREVESE